MSHNISELSFQRVLFLGHTINFYHTKNRAVHPDHFCVYGVLENSPGCAIGKHMTAENAKKLDDAGCDISVSWIYSEGHKDTLPLWMQDLGEEFLHNVQDIHDNDFYWNDKGLSEQGIEKTNQIIDAFGLPIPDGWEKEYLALREKVTQPEAILMEALV